jgi:hypothetical protein
MQHPRPLLFLAPLAVAGCLERDIASAEAYLSASASGTSTATGTSSTTDVLPPIHTVTTHDESSTSTSDAGSTSTAEDTTLSTADATSEPPPVCGDAIVGGEEECDDPTDLSEESCTLTCLRPRLAFLTSLRFTGADIDGLEGADNRCRIAAAMAQLPEPQNFKAILSDSTTSAADRLHHSRGPYRLINGLQVARDFNALMNDTLDNPLDTTELSTKGYPGAWTGTAPGGAAVPGSQHCEDWHSESPSDLGSWGDASLTDDRWLKETLEIVNPTGCVGKKALYCLQQE